MPFSTKHYRWDIQGLRAIAVLAVVIFHINPMLLPGGYIGVDIFFVISGYLILGFIWRDLKRDQFSLLTFYTKRVYRLFPALFVVVVLSSIAAYFILLPNENEIYLKSMVSTLFYFSNFYFIQRPIILMMQWHIIHCYTHGLSLWKSNSICFFLCC